MTHSRKTGGLPSEPPSLYSVVAKRPSFDSKGCRRWCQCGNGPESTGTFAVLQRKMVAVGYLGGQHTMRASKERGSCSLALTTRRPVRPTGIGSVGV